MYNDLNVQDEKLHVHSIIDIDVLKVQNENWHVHSNNDIDNLNVNKYLHVHNKEYHHNFTCSEYKARASGAKEIHTPQPASDAHVIVKCSCRTDMNHSDVHKNNLPVHNEIT